MSRSKDETIRRLRLGDLKRILRWRCGHTLPDDDAGREYLELLLDVVSFVPDARNRMKNITETWAPWMDSAAAFELVEAVLRKPDYLRKLKADQLGEQLNLTYEQRQQLRIRTIAPVDLSAEEFAERRKAQRKARERARKERARRKAGARPRAASLTWLKPWTALGISRATWYRKQTADDETARETTTGAYKLLDSVRTELSQSLGGRLSKRTVVVVSEQARKQAR